MPETRLEALRQVPIFSGLSDADLSGIAQIAFERAYRAGDYVFWEGDRADCFYILAEGRIKVVKHLPAGKDFIIAFFAPGEMFGEVAAFQDKPYPASAQAAVDSHVLGIGSRDFLEFLSRRPGVALRIISVLGHRLREAQDRLRDLAGERAEQRVYLILYMLSLKFGSSLPFTRKEIADMAGTTTETAIRVLSRLKDGKIIRSSRGRIAVIDQTRLQLLSQGPPGI